MDDTVIAVDVGTSMIKAVRLAKRTGALRTATRRAPSDGRPGVDAEQVWDAVCEVLGELAGADTGPVVAVVVTGQGDGLWTLDDEGRPGRAYLWNSVEAAEVVRAWDDAGVVDNQFRRGGTVIWPGTSAALWRWLERTDPDRAEHTRAVFCAKDWVNYRLTGTVTTDISDGSIPFLDLPTGRYDRDAIEQYGCESIESRLAPVCWPGEPIGTITDAASARAGLPAGTPVVLGCLDLVAMILGAGLQDVGDSMVVLGSTAVAVSICDKLPVDREPSGATVKLPGVDRYLRILGSSSGTTTLDWYLRTHGYGGPDRHTAFWDDVLADGGASGKAGALGPAWGRGALMLPYLAGERAPFLAPEATGAFVGLTSGTSRGGLGRAVVEGITHSLRHCLEAADAGPGDVVLAGGGSTRAEWCQLVSDITGRAVVVDGRPDLGALGAASLVPGFMELATRVGTEQRVRYEPSQASGRLQRRYADYLGLVDGYRPIWKELDRS